jgi:hypothetical protein
LLSFLPFNDSMAAMKVQINDRQNGQEGVATPSFMQNLREDASERLKTIHGRKTLSATPDSVATSLR